MLIPVRKMKFKKIIKQVHKCKDNYFKTGVVTDEFLKSILKMSKLDIIHRSGYAIDEFGEFDEIDEKIL